MLKMLAFKMAWLKSLWRAAVMMSSTVRPCAHKNRVRLAMFFFWWLMLLDELVERRLSLLSE
jgi:hypothetical protein